MQPGITPIEITIFFGSIISVLLGTIAFFLKLAMKDLIDVKKKVEHHSLEIGMIKQTCKLIHNNKN